MDDPTIEGSYPEVRFIPSKGSHIHRIERGMEQSDFVAVINKDATLLGAKQKVSRRTGQNGGNAAGIFALRNNLPERLAIECEDFFVSRSNDQFRFARVRQNRGG